MKFNRLIIEPIEHPVRWGSVSRPKPYLRLLDVEIKDDG